MEIGFDIAWGVVLAVFCVVAWLLNLISLPGNWIAVGLVIFAGWNPWRAMAGAYIFGALRRLPLDLQSVAWLPFSSNPILGVWLSMIPYIFTILALMITSRVMGVGSSVLRQ